MIKPNILYVEDDTINAYVMRRFLQNDFNVNILDDGVLAINELRENQYDIILLDINLGNGKMDGVEIMKKIREENLSPSPIFAVTSFAMPGDKEKFLAEGFDDYVSKPVSKEVVISKINQFLKSGH